MVDIVNERQKRNEEEGIIFFSRFLGGILTFLLLILKR